MAGKGGVRVPQNRGPKYDQSGFSIDHHRILEVVKSPTPYEVHRAELLTALYCEQEDGHADIPMGRLLLTMLGREDWT